MNLPTEKDTSSHGGTIDFWDERSKLLRIIAHPVRLMILESLCDGGKCVKDINNLVPIPQPHLSQHMAALRDAELIASHVNGSLRCYYVVRPTLVKRLIKLLTQEHPVITRDRKIVLREVHQN